MAIKISTYKKQAYIYSAVQNVFSGSCFMKQKCQIQMGIAQYKNTATTLKIKDMNTTHQHYQMRYMTLF